MGCAATADRAVLVGASWYPEMWPEDQWPLDLARMNEVGFKIVRVFEFAWHRFEPREGHYDFDWALRVLDLCHQHGIAVMIGTPTAAPPAWLTDRYPDTLQTGPDGRRATHGQRKHYSVYSRTYRRLCRRIVRRMVKAFAGHPAVHSWQIDNEMSGRDFGPEARRGFAAWLKRRFGKIEQLNAAWGLEFWSQAYSSFKQVPLPTAAVGSIEVPERHHPSLIMAAAHYVNDAWTDFIADQCAEIRRRSTKPITTNMAGGTGGMHWFQHNRLLDRVGYSLYKDVEHYPWNLMYLDRMRAEKPTPYWLLETAPSWSAGGRLWNIHHDAAGVAAMSWMCTLMGGSMVLYWQWREHWAGQEMQHGTVVTATGTWRPNKEALTGIATQMSAQGDWLLAHPPAKADVALVLSNESAWAFSIDPIEDHFRYEERWRDEYHLPLVRNHIWRDVIDPTRELDPYKVVIAPLLPILPDAMRARLAAWVRAGGRLLIGPLTGYRTEEFTAFTDRTFGGLEDLIGADSKVRFPVHWVEDRVNVELADGLATRTHGWCEGFAPTTATTLATYRGGYGDGSAAIIEHRVGNGAVIMLGCQVSTEVYLHLVRRLLAEAGVSPVASGSGDVLVVPRAAPGGHVAGYGVVNLVERPRQVTLPAAGRDRLSSQACGPTLDLAPMEVRLVETA